MTPLCTPRKCSRSFWLRLSLRVTPGRAVVLPPLLPRAPREGQSEPVRRLRPSAAPLSPLPHRGPPARPPFGTSFWARRTLAPDGAATARQSAQLAWARPQPTVRGRTHGPGCMPCCAQAPSPRRAGWSGARPAFLTTAPSSRRSTSRQPFSISWPTILPPGMVTEPRPVQGAIAAALGNDNHISIHPLSAPAPCCPPPFGTTAACRCFHPVPLCAI